MTPQALSFKTYHVSIKDITIITIKMKAQCIWWVLSLTKFVSQQALGCQILDVLQESCICGNPDVKDALER